MQESQIYSVAKVIITLSCATALTGVFYSEVGVGWGGMGWEVNINAVMPKRGIIFFWTILNQKTHFSSVFFLYALRHFTISMFLNLYRRRVYGDSLMGNCSRVTKSYWRLLNCERMAVSVDVERLGMR